MPNWDDIPPSTERTTRTYRFTATNVLIVLSFLGFVLTGILPKLHVDLTALHFNAARAVGHGWLWQFATYPFVQIIDFWNIFWFIFAAYMLYQYGNPLEFELGVRKFLTLYFAGAAYGALAHALFHYIYAGIHPDRTPPNLITFYGPAFAVITAYAVRNPSHPVFFFFVVPMRLITAVAIYGLVTLFFCLVYFHVGMSPAGILGASVAAVAMWKGEKWLDRRLEQRRSRIDRDQFLEEVELRRAVDGLLEKISRDGIGSLTPQERKTLKRASALLGRQDSSDKEAP